MIHFEASHKSCLDELGFATWHTLVSSHRLHFGSIQHHMCSKCSTIYNFGVTDLMPLNNSIVHRMPHYKEYCMNR